MMRNASVAAKIRRLIVALLLTFAATTLVIAISAEISAWTGDDSSAQEEARTTESPVISSAAERSAGVTQEAADEPQTQLDERSAPQEDLDHQPLDSPGEASPDGLAQEQDAEPDRALASFVAAYYFHNTHRCPTCLEIEQRAYEAILCAFPDELAAGTLHWQAMNMELPENQHVVFDYDLASPSLVIVLMDGEDEREHRVLTRTWELIHETRTGAFDSYVIAQVQRMLGDIHE